MALAPDDPTFLQKLAAFTGRNGGLSRATEQFGGAGNLGLQLLANSGYSRTPRTLGQTLGVSALQAQQAHQERNNDQLKRAYMEAQIKAMQQKETASPFGQINPAQYTPESVAKFQTSGNYADLIASDKAADAPSNIREYEYFKTLPKEEQQRYLEMKRSYNPYMMGEVAGVQSAFNRQTGQATPLTTLPQETAGQSAIASAKASGAATGEATAKAAFDLPRIQQNVAQSIETIDKLSSDKGLNYITGMYSKLPVVPGTDQARADALAKQVEGQTFLQAFNALKGAGAITDTEGTKATGAIARLQRSQSAGDYKEALKELRGVLSAGLDRLTKQAGGTTAEAGVSGPKRIQNDSDYDALPSGATFIGPDGKQRRKP
jgi:hypothetical protein